MFGELPAPKAHDIIADSVAQLRAQNDIPASGDLFAAPEVTAAHQVAEQSPDLRVVLEDGTEVSARKRSTDRVPTWNAPIVMATPSRRPSRAT